MPSREIPSCLVGTLVSCSHEGFHLNWRLACLAFLDPQVQAKDSSTCGARNDCVRHPEFGHFLEHLEAQMEKLSRAA